MTQRTRLRLYSRHPVARHAAFLGGVVAGFWLVGWAMRGFEEGPDGRPR